MGVTQSPIPYDDSFDSWLVAHSSCSHPRTGDWRIIMDGESRVRAGRGAYLVLMSKSDDDRGTSASRVGLAHADNRFQVIIMIVDGLVFLGSILLIVVTMVLWYFGAWGILMELVIMAVLATSTILSIADIVMEVLHGETNGKESHAG
jgi:hypothetical protein